MGLIIDWELVLWPGMRYPASTTLNLLITVGQPLHPSTPLLVDREKGRTVLVHNFTLV